MAEHRPARHQQRLQGALRRGLPTAARSIALTYIYTDTEIVNSADRLRNRPRNRGSVSFRYASSEALSFTCNSAIVGQVYDFSVPTGNVVLESY